MGGEAPADGDTQAPRGRQLDEPRETELRRLVDEAVGNRYVASNRRTGELTGLDLTA